MKTVLLQVWKRMPLWLKIFSSRLIRRRYMVAVAAIIFDGDGRILLGKHTYRKQHPWGILAGNLEYGEDPENATIRELLEETGLEGKVQRLLRAVSAKEDHHISLIYLCEIVKGAFHQSPEISAIQYFSTDDLPDMLFTEKILIAQIVNQLDTGK